MHLSAVAKRSANSAVAGEEDIFLEDLRGLIWDDQRGSTWQDLADKAGLSYSTVRNFAVGDTKRPQVRTVRLLLGAVGIRFAMVPISLGHVPGELGRTRH